MRRLISLLLVASMAASTSAQTTTANLQTTVAASHVDRPGMNFGGKATYDQAQVLKDLLQNGGNVIGYYWQTTYSCSAGGPVASIAILTPGSGQTPGTYPIAATGGGSGGSGAIVNVTVDGTGAVTATPTIFLAGSGYTSTPTFTVPAGGVPATFTVTVGASPNDATHWFGASHYVTGFPASFWVGATYTALHQDGTVLGTGTVTASTDGTNLTASGITFTLGTAISAACTPGTNTANTDIIIMRQRGSSFGVVDANTKYQHSGTLAFSTDVDPASTNNQQSLNVSTGGDVHFFLDASGGYTPYVGHATGPYTYLNINGSFTLTYRTKCLGSTGSVAYDLRRIGGSPFTTGTDTISACSATSGAGWQQFSHTFTGTETGHATTSLQFQLTCTSAGGSCDFQDMRIIESTPFPGLNPTVFRDSVVDALQNINPGSLRFMSPPGWCSDANDQTAPLGQQRACGLKNYDITSASNSIGYDDELELANFIGAEPWITLGHFNTPADWVTMVNWLNSSGWNATFAAKGQHIYLEDGNELWNPGATGNIDCGNGNCYGVLLGQHMAAARGAAGYSASVDRFVGGGWASKSQAYATGGGWVNNVLTHASCTTGSANCPDFMDFGPYFLTNLTDPITTTSPYLDQIAEIHNWDTVQTDYHTGNVNSMYAAQKFVFDTFGVNAAAYEFSQSIASGSGTPTQDQMNQTSQGLHMALTDALHPLLMARDAGITGPRNEFAFVDQPFITAINGTVQTSWSAEAYMAAGPGQAWTDVPFPKAIAYQVMNQAIGNKSNMMTATQSGTPTFNYPGGENTSIVANAAVNYVETFLYSDGAGNYALIAFNTDPVNAHDLALTGAAAPTGSVQKTVLTGAPTDNNSTSVTANNPTQVVTMPSTSSGTCAGTLPANSLTTCTYSLSSGPNPNGTFNGIFNVKGSFSIQ